MKQKKSISAEDLTAMENLREIVAYCKKYEEENKKCVSYYMLATYAYEKKKESWITLLRKKIYRDTIAKLLKSNRAQSKYCYEIPLEEAMERYVKAREEYENFKMVQDEEMAHIEHEQELRERENGETY